MVLYRNVYFFGRKIKHHGRGQRELQVLDGDAGRPEEPRGAADTIPIEKESLRQGTMESAAVPALFRRHL